MTFPACVDHPKQPQHPHTDGQVSMKEVPTLADVPAVPEQIVIINCGTRWVTTLALMSAMTIEQAPVLVINCGSGDGSYGHFSRLARKYRLRFYWLEWPLRTHPAALDQLFGETTADTLLLMDSDVEIIDPGVIEEMRHALWARAGRYGSGFLHGPFPMGEEHGMHAGAGLYAERMWIPCVLLRTADVRSALRAGASFAGRRTFHDFNGHPRLSQLTALRYKLPLLRKARLPFRSHSPSFIEYDTGADLHAWMKNHDRTFGALPQERWGGVTHYHGVTRARLASPLLKLALHIRQDREVVFNAEAQLLDTVKRRLDAVYAVSLDV